MERREHLNDDFQFHFKTDLKPRVSGLFFLVSSDLQSKNDFSQVASFKPLIMGMKRTVAIKVKA